VFKFPQKYIHARYALKFKEICFFNFGDDILTGRFVTIVETNLRTSYSWNTIRIMKHYTQNHLSCLTMPILHNSQSSSSGKNKIIASEITANPLWLHNCNKTCKSISISVVV